MDALRRKLRQSPAYTAVREARLHWRTLVERDRALPDFLIIGAHKGGTSSFYENLVTHPQVYPSLTKEVHYFDRDPRPSLRWYRAHFPSREELRRNDAICGEATPSYAIYPGIPADIKTLLPKAKLIFLLRDPVKRAYSAYQFNSRRGAPAMSFEDWIERDFDLLGGQKIDRSAFMEYVGNNKRIDKVPVALLRGIYVEQIRNWHSVFSQDRLTIIESSEYFRDPSKVLNAVATQSLGLRPHQFAYRKTHHEKRGYPKMRDETRARLEAFFKPYNEALYTYLGRDFGW
jgi:hypothetical protein